MHRISGDTIDPIVDTKAKLSSVTINPGYQVLDTCLGLGYTAIGAAKKLAGSGKVTSIEYDDASIEMCSFNPWSQALFDGSLPIEIQEVSLSHINLALSSLTVLPYCQGDACELVKSMKPESFNTIIHDHPAQALCRTDLYGLEFYRNLRRILSKNGQLFHYIGNPASKESGRLYGGIIDRLLKAGFKTVQKVDAAFGVRAYN